jgi:hypothetical protein
MIIRDKKNIGYLVLLEFVDEANVFLKEYLNEFKSDADKFEIISFHPLVKSYLLRHRIDAVDSFHFCPTASHQKLLCVLEEYTEQIRRNCCLKDSTGVENSYVENLINCIRSILSLWFYQIEVISNAIEYYLPETVVSIRSEPLYIEQNVGIGNKERFIADVARQICNAKKIVFKSISLQIGSKNFKEMISRSLKKTLSEILYSTIQRINNPEKKLIIAPTIDSQMDKVLNDLKRKFSDNYTLAVIGLSYKAAFHNICGLFTKNRPDYGYLPCHKNRNINGDSVFIEQKNKFSENLSKTINSWNYRGVIIGSWLNQKYKNCLESEVIDKTYGHSYNLNKYLDKWKPVFVFSPCSRMFTAVLGELSGLKNIPSMMIPHGSFTPAYDEYSEKEWKENALGIINTPYKYVAVQTPLAEEYLSDVSLNSKPVITGPLSFGRQMKKSNDIVLLRRRYASDEEVIILHAGTPKHRSSPRLLNYETIDEYVDGMVSLVNAVSKLNGVHLILRYRPIDGLSSETLKGLLPESDSCSIASGGAFSDYLSITNLLVSFSSTTIEEALQNNIPVLLFNKYNRYQHIKGVELSSGSSGLLPAAVYNVNSEDDLLSSIQWILTNHLSKKINSEKLFSEYKYPDSKIIKLSEFIKDVVIKTAKEIRQ